VRASAFTDYRVRIREAIALVRVALGERNPVMACAHAKGAVVMTAAALERFVNDAAREACKSIKHTKWAELTPGHRRYLCRQFALRLQSASKSILEDGNDIDTNEGRLRKVLETCAVGMAAPDQWAHVVDFGMFMEGQAAPEKIDKVLGQFDGTGRGIYGLLKSRGWDKEALLRSLSQLITARHGVAHALPEAPSVSPRDAQAWLVSSFWLAVHIDDFLAHAPSGRFPLARSDRETGEAAPSA
jgi:hypothetical protein